MMVREPIHQICTHDMHKLTSERTPGTTASTANVAEAKSGNFMLY